MRKQLKKLFQPKSIAVIGASDTEASVGFMVMKNLLAGSYKGHIFPVNIKHKKVHGLKAYYHIADLPEAPDLAIITTPAYAVLQVVRECGEAGVGALAILSAGFRETGEESKFRLERIRQIAHAHNMRVLGPNCLGFMAPHLGLNASFSTVMAQAGNIAFISQSGTLGIATLDQSIAQNIGFSYFVSIGTMADVAYADLIDFFGTDHHTNCILIYMESLKEIRRFMSAARSFARYKPIIVLKAGRSMEGQKVSLSHTGVLAGNDDAFSAAFRRSGIIRVSTMAQLFNCAQSLAMQPRPSGNRLAILTNAGAPGVLATDYLMANGGQLAKLSEKTFEALNDLLPVNWSHNNPVNLLGDASADKYQDALRILLRDPNIDAVLVILTYQAMTTPEAVAKAIVAINKKSNKPILASWMGQANVEISREILEAGKVPNYRYPESAVDVFLKIYQYNRNLALLTETPPEEPHQFRSDKAKARKIINQVLADGRHQMLETEAKDLLKCYQLPVTHYQLVTNLAQAKAFAEAHGYPLAVKIASSQVYHKSDLGGVALNIQSLPELEKAYHRVLKNVQHTAPEIEVSGVVIERMIQKKFELFIGARKDPVIGPVLAFGRGGIDVEIHKDTQLGLPPMNMALAQRMIEGTQIYPLLRGYRNRSGVDQESLAFTLCKFAYLIMDFPEIQEVDINPFAMDQFGEFILDAHIVLDPKTAANPPKSYGHLAISPYPGRYQKKIEARNGQEVLLRPIRPEDEPLELAMVERLSKESLYFRFFGYVPKMTHELMIRFTQIDYDREMAIVALTENAAQQTEMIGVVRIIADPWGEAAEYAILVADEWQGQGIGGQMTDYIIEIGREMGLKSIYATVLASNKGMISLFKKKGFTVKREDFDTYRVDLELEKG
ncbi:MAG: GNAT family N-acetyltransferase [Saprospiraceae bacterium]|nr:GNAT family N-acetyltransferase [Saprospiraceae bacterium]